MDKRTVKKAMILNLCIFILEVFANCWMLSGITVSGNGGTLSAARLGMFRYFTVDSNIFMGLIALYVAVEQCMVLKDKKTEVSKCASVLELVGTVGVTLTMLVTVFFLAPTMAAEHGWFANFKNSNFFLHLVNPILSIVVFLGFEKTDKISFKHTCTGVVPMLIYSCYYVGQAVKHAENGLIPKAYDWYGFFMMGLKSIVIVLPIIIAATYLMSLCLWKLNKAKVE